MIEIIIDAAMDIDQGPTGPQQLMWRVGRGGGRQVSAERDACGVGLPVWKCPRPRRYSKLYSGRWGDESQAEALLTNRRQRECEQPGQLQTGPQPPTALWGPWASTLSHLRVIRQAVPPTFLSQLLVLPSLGSTKDWLPQTICSPWLQPSAMLFGSPLPGPSTAHLPDSHTPEASRILAWRSPQPRAHPIGKLGW